MPNRIKLMTDYDCFPLWDQSGALPANIDPHILPLQPGTIVALFDWADRYDATLNRDDPLESGFLATVDSEAFEHQGLQLWHTLQTELGQDYEVSYFSNQQRRLISPSEKTVT